jgi:formiminotetrahydrofolate cyclodeaminase
MKGRDETQTAPEPALGGLWDRLADPDKAPGGGSASAVAVEMASALVAKAARRSTDSWPDAAGVAAQASALAARCAELAELDARAFGAALKALEDRAGIEERLGESVDVLLALAEAATDVAELAALTAEQCDGTFRGDAICAALLAEAAACGAAVLVAGNLTVTGADERLARAKRLGELATRAVGRALETGP